MLNSLEIESQLIKLGFEQHVTHERINGFTRNDIDSSLYVKTPSGNSTLEYVAKNPLVIHSKYKAHEDSFPNEDVGVYPDWNKYFHSTGLKGFDKRIHKGKSEIYYGIAIGIENENALEKFVEWLSRTFISAKPSLSEYEDIENAKDELYEAPETIREALILARKGQGQYRAELIDYWNICSVSDVTLQSFLRASHIKPWRDSNNSERLDKYNGLLLNPILDVAFDKGFISFSNEGKILISEALNGKENELFISAEMSLKKVEAEHINYLEWHRRNIFKKL